MSDSPPSMSPQDALVAVMIAVSASDEQLRTAELVAIQRIVNHAPIFAGYDSDRIRQISQTVFDLFEEEDGLDALFGLIRDALPERLNETAYALACDVVIAAESASFIQAFTRIGLIPDAGGTYWLPRQIGMARAMGAALFAEKITAAQAVDWGMIWEAVPDAGFAAHVAGRAAHLATGPTSASTWSNRVMARLRW